MFNLKRPCANCPFKIGRGHLFRLDPDRIREMMSGAAFQCHKTVDYDHEHDSIKRQGQHPNQCAGLMSLLRNVGEPNQIMQIAERLGELDLDDLDPDNEAYQSLEDALKAHVEGVEPE